MLQGLPPLLNSATRVLILGSFPSVKSLQLQQYYAHPQNQLWRLIFNAKSADGPRKYCTSSYEIKSKQLLEMGIGLWDVYAACERVGSLDSAIQHAQLNDLSSLRQRCPQLRAIAHNGGESYKHAKAVDTLLNRANHGPDSANHSPDPRTPIEVFKLPSSSPANASWSFERKLQVWQSVLEKYAP